MNSRNSIIALMVLAVLLVGCSPSPADGPSLEGTQWVLVTLEGKPPLTGTALSAEFSADQISGSAGCNHYFGTYAVSGNDITISDVGSTEMYCIDPEGVMDQEQAFLAVLASAASYRLAETRLELLDGAGSVILAFEPPPAVSEAPTSAPPMPTAEPTEIPPALAFEPPTRFKQYQDSVTGSLSMCLRVG